MRALQLDDVGRELIAEVRDRTISRLFALVEGTLKSAEAQALQRDLFAATIGRDEVVKRLVVESVDSTLHQVLMWLEQSERVDAQVRVAEGAISLKDLSDGLAGELYGARGWVARFSTKPHRET